MEFRFRTQYAFHYKSHYRYDDGYRSDSGNIYFSTGAEWNCQYSNRYDNCKPGCAADCECGKQSDCYIACFNRNSKWKWFYGHNNKLYMDEYIRSQYPCHYNP